MSNTDASQFALATSDVCRLSCVEFTYTSVSARYAVRGLECQHTDFDDGAILQAEMISQIDATDDFDDPGIPSILCRSRRRPQKACR